MVKTLNQQLFKKAKSYMPGGVNSPVRSFKGLGGYPIFMKKAKGSKIYAEDGRVFIDYCLSFGALILGHAHPAVIRVLKRTIDKGTSFGTATKAETELARYLAQAIPSLERIRLTNSGTEAVMGAIRLARAYTGKNKIIRFSGSYHGHADYLLDCPGIPEVFKAHTLVVPYNDIEKTKAMLKRHSAEVAAVIVEPVAANMGVVLPQDAFLRQLRALTRQYRIVLIFDEVITGFRLGYGGAQKIFNIKPDLTCLGKIIGGGLPIGAFGGRKEIMRLLAPEGDVYQAGTFSGNPVSVNAGLATLKILSKKSPYEKLESLTRGLCRGIKNIAAKHGIRIKINAMGSMFSLFFSGREIRDYASSGSQDSGLFKRFYQGLLKEGVYFAPSGFEANFLSLAHTGKDIGHTLEAVDRVLASLRRR